MNRTLKSSLLAATVLTLGAVVVPAAASSVPGSGGTAFYSSDAGCFPQNEVGGLKNTCAGGYRRLRFSLTAHAAGPNNVYVYAQGTGLTTDVYCGAYAASSDRVVVSGWGTYLPLASSSTQVISITGVSVPAGGSLFVDCYVGANAWINNVSYSP